MIAEFQESGYLVYLLSTKSNQMKHLMTLLALVVAVTAGAQTATWDPDYNGDSIIGVDDLLGLLSLFGFEGPTPAFNSIQNSCHIFISDFGYQSDQSNYHYDIPDTCSHAIVTCAYGSSYPVNVEDRAKIRLPESGVFEGQKIFMFRTADYAQPYSFEVQHLVDGYWITLTLIQEDNGPGNQNWDSPLSNKVFTWIDNEWIVSSPINHIDVIVD